jgi:hypothetical protein
MEFGVVFQLQAAGREIATFLKPYFENDVSIKLA